MHMEIERSFLSIVFKNLERFIQRANMRTWTSLPLRSAGACQGVYMKAPDRTGGKRDQDIRNFYGLAGFVPVEELLKQKTA